MWITRVSLAGVDVDLDDCFADVIIRHGRTTIDDAPTASTVQLRLLNVTREFSSAFKVGVPVVVEADGVPRFTGTVTDATLDDDELRVIGAGPLSTLSQYLIGAAPWPAELWADRVVRAFTEAGIPALLKLAFRSDWAPLLAARGAVDDPPEQVDLYTYLQALADDVGAAIVDTPDGHVLVQEITTRTVDVSLSWNETPATILWSGVDPGCDWTEATTINALDPSYAPAATVPIDPNDVVFVPPWEQELTVENATTVAYGDGLAVTATETTSIGLYGRRPGGVQTEFVNAADALQRATERVARRAFPRWVIHSAPLLRGYPVAIGQTVELTDFPPSSPFGSWTPIVEGWTDTIDRDLWTCELALSDPILSGVSLYWVSVPPDVAWIDVDPACDWTEATELGALNPTTRGNLVNA